MKHAKSEILVEAAGTGCRSNQQPANVSEASFRYSRVELPVVGSQPEPARGPGDLSVQPVRWCIRECASHLEHSRPGYKASRRSGCEQRCRAAGERSSRQPGEQAERWQKRLVGSVEEVCASPA